MNPLLGPATSFRQRLVRARLFAGYYAVRPREGCAYPRPADLLLELETRLRFVERRIIVLVAMRVERDDWGVRARECQRCAAKARDGWHALAPR